MARIADGLLMAEVKWSHGTGGQRRLKGKDILIVVPHNAQAANLSARLPHLKIGTVDKFQGQEAPVVIYSMTTSSPSDIPNERDFFYSLNRFNVATSRAMTAVIVVGDPQLFEPQCRSTGQMQQANVLCRYREMAVQVDPARIFRRETRRRSQEGPLRT